MSAHAVHRPDGDAASFAERARASRDRLVALRAEEQELTRVRDEAIRTLSALGLSYDAIAEIAGVSRARVGQIVTSGRPNGSRLQAR